MRSGMAIYNFGVKLGINKPVPHQCNNKCSQSTVLKLYKKNTKVSRDGGAKKVHKQG